MTDLDDATIDRIAKRVAYYLRLDNQERGRELAAEHRRQVPLEVIEEASKIPADAVEEVPWRRPRCGGYRHRAIAETTKGCSMSRTLAEATPPGTRLILASENLLEQWGARTSDGYRISAEWGDSKPEGWYEPLFTIHYDDDLRKPLLGRIEELVAALNAALPIAEWYAEYAGVTDDPVVKQARAALEAE